MIETTKISYFGLARAYPRLLLIGVYHTFFSTFGQTVLLAVYVESICRDFSISLAKYGAIYGGVTIASALLLPLTGPAIDRINLRLYSLLCSLVVTVGCLIIYSTSSLTSFTIGLVLVRHGGQGLLPLCTSTTMARYFSLNRGKALGLSNLGFAMGEATLPLLVIWSLSFLSWRETYLATGIFCLLFFIIANHVLIKSGDDFADPTLIQSNKKTNELNSPLEVLKSPYFYAINPALLMAPFVMTALFFYQAELAQIKGWSVTLVASGISGFALTRFLFSLLGGPLIDRFSAVKLVVFTLIPLLLALILFQLINAEWSIGFFWGLCGATVGLGSNAKQAIWAEVYGTSFLGAIKSLSGPFTVLSTAASPFLVGFLFDQGVSATDVVNYFIILIVVVGIVAALANHFRQRQAN